MQNSYLFLKDHVHSQEGELGYLQGYLSPTYRKIIQFARIFEKQIKKSKIIVYKKFENHLNLEKFLDTPL